MRNPARSRARSCWSPAWPEQLRRRELGQSVKDSGEEGVAVAVAGVVDHVQPAGAPPLGQTPGRLQRAADIVASVDQHTGDAVQGRRVAEQLVVLSGRRRAANSA